VYPVGFFLLLFLFLSLFSLLQINYNHLESGGPTHNPENNIATKATDYLENKSTATRATHNLQNSICNQSNPQNLHNSIATKATHKIFTTALQQKQPTIFTPALQQN